MRCEAGRCKTSIITAEAVFEMELSLEVDWFISQDYLSYLYQNDARIVSSKINHLALESSCIH